jgi:hypothetical protein
MGRVAAVLDVRAPAPLDRAIFFPCFRRMRRGGDTRVSAGVYAAQKAAGYSSTDAIRASPMTLTSQTTVRK